ncbi:hypothetical protein V6N12_009914 [Hibiscus sabdariffa]|uniref:Secreted protein n=1 Tax=Hibiscus sabdariffa TaxID=183260 RepID=A0ABR2EC47_9ROSI
MIYGSVATLGLFLGSGSVSGGACRSSPAKACCLTCAIEAGCSAGSGVGYEGIQIVLQRADVAHCLGCSMRSLDAFSMPDYRFLTMFVGVESWAKIIFDVSKVAVPRLIVPLLVVGCW